MKLPKKTEDLIATTKKMSKQAETFKNTENFDERQKNHEIRIKATQGDKKTDDYKEIWRRLPQNRI